MFDIFEQERIAGDLYNMQRAEQERRMGRAGDDQPVVASTTMTPEAVTPEEVTQGFPITAPGAIPPFLDRIVRRHNTRELQDCLSLRYNRHIPRRQCFLRCITLVNEHSRT